MSWSGKEYPSIYVPTTGRSSSPKICASGWPMQEPGHCTSNLDHPGRTATANRSTRNSEMSSSMGDLLLHQGAARAGRALAHPLQHRQTTLFAGLSTTGAGSMADLKQQWAWRSGNRSALPTSPHPRRRLSINTDNCVTLTPHWYKTSGKPQLRGIMAHIGEG